MGGWVVVVVGLQLHFQALRFSLCLNTKLFVPLCIFQKKTFTQLSRPGKTVLTRPKFYSFTLSSEIPHHCPSCWSSIINSGHHRPLQYCPLWGHLQALPQKCWLTLAWTSVSSSAHAFGPSLFPSWPALTWI